MTTSSGDLRRARGWVRTAQTKYRRAASELEVVDTLAAARYVRSRLRGARTFAQKAALALGSAENPGTAVRDLHQAVGALVLHIEDVLAALDDDIREWQEDA
ncbi:hypothetical protein [Mycobacterium sp.]|uniref:hypothetical protein n=1 Tax=Mycobacterium sp. TaxID=1785 RepID=UPI003F961B1C